MIKFNHLWYLLHICCDFAIIVNPFFRAVQATVVEKHHTPRPYIVQKPEGQKYRRSRRHLNKSRVSQALNKGTVKTSQVS